MPKAGCCKPSCLSKACRLFVVAALSPVDSAADSQRDVCVAHSFASGQASIGANILSPKLIRNGSTSAPLRAGAIKGSFVVQQASAPTAAYRCQPNQTEMRLRFGDHTAFHEAIELVRWHSRQQTHTGSAWWNITAMDAVHRFSANLRYNVSTHSRTASTPGVNSGNTSTHCYQSRDGHICVAHRFVMKKVNNYQSYIKRKNVCCALHGVPHMQELLHYDDACQILWIKKDPTARKGYDGVNKVIQNGLLLSPAALVRRDEAALTLVFDALAKSRLFPNDLSICCNVMRTGKNRELLVIDYGAYRFHNNVSALVSELKACKADILFSIFDCVVNGPRDHHKKKVANPYYNKEPGQHHRSKCYERKD